jgi:hypothetical protein
MKKFVIGIGTLVLLVVVGAMVFLPRFVPVERKLVINTSPETVYPHLVNLEEWQKWNPWGAKDPGMKISYGDKKEGEGASYSWMSESQGSGTMTITKAVEPSRMETELDFGDQGKAKAYFELKSVGENQTEVVWHIDADMGNSPVGRVFGTMMDGMIGPDFEDGLSRLKKLAESGDSAPSEPSATPQATPTP